MIRISKKLRNILDEIDRLAWTEVTRQTSDEEFIATIDAINTRCNLADAIGEDRSELRNHMTSLYPEFTRRIYAKRNIQEAWQLIDALYAFIYMRDIADDDRGPERWRLTLLEMVSKLIVAYRKEPIIPACYYVRHLNYYASQSCDNLIREDVDLETMAIVNNQLEKLSDNDISVTDLMQAILTRTAVRGNPYLDCDRDIIWTEHINRLLARINLRKLSDNDLRLWLRTAQSLGNWYLPLDASFNSVMPALYKEVSRRPLPILSLTYLAWRELRRLKAASRPQLQPLG